MNGNEIVEADKTRKARKLLVSRFRDNGFVVAEEMPIAGVTNNLGEPIKPAYQADIYLKLEFIIELDPNSSHKSARKANHDQHRDRNIWNQYRIKTVRLNPSDISEKTLETVGEEIVHQLRSDKYQ